MILALLTAIAALPGLPQTEPAPQIAPAAMPAPPPVAEKKTCRRMDVTGSIIPFRRVCNTPAGWAKFDEAANEAWESARYSKNRSWGKSLPTE